MATGSGSHLTSQISFSSVDYTVNTSNIGSAATGTDSVVSGDSSASVVTAVHELETDKTSKNQILPLFKLIELVSSNYLKNY